MKTKVISLILAAALIVSGCAAGNGDTATPVTEPSTDATEVTEPVPTETEATPPATEVTESSTEMPTTEATEPVVEPTDPVVEPTVIPSETEPVTEPVVEPTDPVTEPTVVPTETEATDPVVDPTDPIVEPTQTEPQTEVTEVPIVTDPPVTEPVVTEPPTEATVAPTEPTVTEPVVTDPPVTEPTVTIPPTEATTVPTEPPHVHEYVDKVVAPTCTKKGYTIHTCSCGDSFKDSETKALGHRFDSYVSNGDATCEKDGTKTAVCENGCGEKDTVKDSGSALGHSYSEKVVSPTCTEKGYTLHKCQVCGDSFKDSYTEAGEHDYVITKEKAPLINIEGYIVYTCESCGDSYTQYTYMTDEEADAFIREVEKATAYYINQFRMEQGDTEATILPGLTQVAQYRAVQLQSNFEHSLVDLEAAYDYYNYGRWVDATEYGDPPEYSYYTADAKEAIAWTGVHGTADEIGLHIATILRNSKNHWAYLGSSDFPYLAVGISHNYKWYICTLQTKENYG